MQRYTYFILQNKYLCISEDSFGAKILRDDCAATSSFSFVYFRFRKHNFCIYLFLFFSKKKSILSTIQDYIFPNYICSTGWVGGQNGVFCDIDWDFWKSSRIGLFHLNHPVCICEYICEKLQHKIFSSIFCMNPSK